LVSLLCYISIFRLFIIVLFFFRDNHVEDYVTGEGSVLPEGLVTQVSGSIAFDERYEPMKYSVEFKKILKDLIHYLKVFASLSFK